MPKVKSKENENIDSLLRRFKTQVNRSNNLNHYKEKESYISKSNKDRLAKNKTIRDNKKTNLKNNLKKLY